MKKIQYIILGIALFLVTITTNAQKVYTVTKTTDPDPFEHPFNYDDNLCDPEMYGTLQWAIRKVNEKSGEFIIDFNIPGTGIKEIVLNSYLPQILNDVTIDGTTQNGYADGSPNVKINGYLFSKQSCFRSSNHIINIEGIWFANFPYVVCTITDARDSYIKNNVITHNLNTSKYSLVFAVATSDNILFYNNIIKDEADDPNSRYYTYGFYFKSSNNMTVGDTEAGQGNTITNCRTALFLGDSQHIKISGNRIYNNNKAMEFLYGSNGDIQPPEIYKYDEGVLKGSALPNSTIEVFGSTGEENANEYLVSVVADESGEWSVGVSTVYEYFAFNQTDISNNTSKFSFERFCVYPHITYLENHGIISVEEIVYTLPPADWPTNWQDTIPPSYLWDSAQHITLCLDSEPLLLFDQGSADYLTIDPDNTYNLDWWWGDCEDWHYLSFQCDYWNPERDLNTIDDPVLGETYEFVPSEWGVGTHVINTQWGSNCDLTRIYITVLPTPDATITPVEPLCLNAQTITLTAATSGGVWSGEGITNSTNGTFDPFVAGEGIHEIIYSISDTACPGIDTTYIEVLPIPDITPTNDGPVCVGQDVHFSSASESTIVEYQWFGPGGTLDTIPGFTIPNAQLNHAGDYMVTVTDENGCTNQAVTTLELFDPQVNIIADDTVICNSESISLDAGTGWFSYQWSTGENTQVIEVDEPDTYYSVTITDIHGCEGIDTIYIEGSNMFIFNTIIAYTCEGANIGSISHTINGGDYPLIFEWTGPNGFTANTEDISNLYAGQYFFTVTDVNGCQAFAQYIINDFENPDLAITSDTICYEENSGTLEVSVTNMTGSFIYEWSNGENTAIISNLTGGNYTVTVTNSDNGCFSTILSVILNYPIPEVTINAEETIICNMVPITLDAGNGWSSYDWSTGDTTQIIEVHTPDADYSVTITDIHGCEGIDTIHIGGSNIAIKDSLVVHTCEGENDGSIIQTIVGGDEPLIFEWAGPDGFTANTEDISELFAGQYSFTVTDANGCFLEEVYIVEDFENPDLIISSDYVCNSENTGSLEVSVTNLPGPFDILWSNNETTFIITNQAPGEYTVTVTDNQSGCSASITSLIDNYIVDASFSLNDDCLDLDRIGNQYFDLHLDFEYSAIDWQNYDFSWDLGNGTVGTELTVPVDYSLDGYYCVTATVSREECFSTVSDIVYVYPNRCYCIEEEWDTEFYNDYTVQQIDEYWGGIFRRIRGQIIVPNGHTLTLHKCELVFGTKGGITVEQGGTLIVSQTTMTSKGMGSCDGMWAGIEVHGQWGLPTAQQGNVRFINGGNIIENAHIGILLGERNVEYVCNPNINPELGPFNTQGSCGWVKADDVDFVNNGTDIRFVKPIGNYQYNDPSAVKNCDFTSTILLDECYNSSHPSHYGNSVSQYGDPIPANTRNPWAGGSNPTQRSAQGFWMQNHRFNSSFDFDTLINKEICVETYDSKYNVTHSYFNTAKFGIRIYNTLSTANNAHKIYQNTFDNIPGIAASSGAHIFIGGGILDRIRDNKFGSSYTDQNLTNTGIYTRGASRFIIEENEFNRLWTGVFVGSSGTQSSDVRAGTSDVHLDWRGNNFFQCRTNIYTRGTNARLRLRCNNCKNDLLSLHYVNFHNQGYLANQGTFLSSTPQQYWGAGNEFTDGSDNNPAPVARYIKSDYAYRYVYHSNLKTTPVIYPGSVLNPQPLGLTKAENSISCFTFTLPFPFPFIPAVPGVPGTGIPDIEDILPILPDVLNEIDYLEQVRINLKNSEDGGKTEQLLNDISNHIPNGQLKNKLISNSPLSDTVITALLIEYPLSHGNFKSVMVKNMPVSPAVEPYLFARLETLPQGIRQQLKPLQSFNPNVNTVSSTTRNIDYLTQERELLVNEILMIFTDTAYYNPEYIKQILAAENNPQFDMNLAAFLIGEGNYSDAIEIINDIEPVNKETSDWIDYHQILLSLFNNNKTIYQMDSTQLAFITDLAYACPSNYTTSNAQAVLHLLFGTEFEECEEMVNRRSFSLIKDVVFTIPDTDAWVEDNFPNPFTDETLINYYLPEESTGSIVVTDMYGREIAFFNLSSGENTLIVKSNAWAPGVYSYSFIVDGKSLEHKKMIITQ